MSEGYNNSIISKNIQEEKKENTMFGLDISHYPSRMGKAWDEEEVIKLLKSIQKKKSIKEIAVVHQRTEGGIACKLRGLAADYYIYDKKTIDEIQKYTGLSKEDIVEAIQRKEYRMSLQKNKEQKVKESKVSTKSESCEPSLNELMLVMKDIQYKMNIILEKIK